MEGGICAPRAKHRIVPVYLFIYIISGNGQALAQNFFILQGEGGQLAEWASPLQTRGRPGSCLQSQHLQNEFGVIR